MRFCLLLCIFQTLFQPKPMPLTDSAHCIESQCRPALEQLITSIESLYNTPRGSIEHRLGEPVSQKEHALQTAEMALYQAPTQRYMVVAALLHDIGQLLAEENDPSYRIFDQIGAHFVTQIWGPQAAMPILHSIEAKRFLAATDPGYVSRLSIAKQNSLAFQGGALLQDSAEYIAFVKLPDVLSSLALRRWDDQAMTAGKKTKKFSDFRPILVEEALYYLASLYPKHSAEEIASWIQEADERVMNALSYD